MSVCLRLIVLAMILSVLPSCASMETYQKGREVAHRGVDVAFDAALVVDAAYDDLVALYEYYRCLVVECPPPVEDSASAR